MTWWKYENLPSGEPYEWYGGGRGDRPDDQIDFHLDLGCGRLKKGRLGIDQYPDDGVDLVINLNSLLPTEEGISQQYAMTLRRTIELYNDWMRDWKWPEEKGLPQVLPFPNNSIESIISHHALEHIGDGFVRLMDECYRVLKPGAMMRVVVPLFPSHASVADPDHKRYFGEGTFRYFTGDPEGKSWTELFSTPYTKARFFMPETRADKQNPDVSAPPPDPRLIGTEQDQREMRVTLFKWGN